MTAITIRRGLRRLEFSPQRDTAHDDSTRHVVVEFAVSEKLSRDQIVRINLGLCEGKERILEGRPSVVKSAEASASTSEFVYRIEGEVG